MVSSPTGQSYITDKFKMIPVYKDMQPKGLGGVSSDILAFAAKDKVIPWTFGQFPDGWANDVFNDVQSYVARKMSWDQVLQQMQQSWTQHKK
jgi:raffinose/stachyose/melibiose transport system substrate-binding protein